MTFSRVIAAMQTVTECLGLGRLIFGRGTNRGDLRPSILAPPLWKTKLAHYRLSSAFDFLTSWDYIDCQSADGGAKLVLSFASEGASSR